MSRFLLNILNKLLNIAVAVSLVLSADYAGYALWDNSHIYSVIDDVQKDMIKLKPLSGVEDNGESFEKLREVNSDVRAWLSMDNTGIDYPVLQGENNMTYINTDVYGGLALQGSIFMDSRNSPDFSQEYIVLYGHHMEGGKMFGDLDKFKDRKFFEENGGGELILPDRAYSLQMLGTLVVPASDRNIFSPLQWEKNSAGLLKKLDGGFKFVNEDLLSEINGGGSCQILALTTCTNEFTDARTVVLAVMTPIQTAGMEE